MIPTTIHRCAWAKTELGIAYHDREWGVPQHDDRVLFEFLVLEGAQAGLTWETILPEREILPRRAEGIRRLRQLRLAVCRGPAAAEHPADHAGNSRPHRGIRGDEQRLVGARLQIRRPDDLLRVHAGGRPGERSHGGLFPPPGNRPSGSRTETTLMLLPSPSAQSLLEARNLSKHF